MNFFKRIGAAFHTCPGAYIFFALAVLAFAMLSSAKWTYWFIEEMLWDRRRRIEQEETDNE